MRSTLQFWTILFALSTGLQFLYGQTASTLVWSDEFEGTGIPDTSKWDQPEYNRRNNDNGPDGWWSKEDSFLDGEGNLVIRVRKIDNKNSDNDPHDYSVGAIHSIHKFEQTYGKFEMRARLPVQPGWWVAFWMMQGEVGSTANEGVDGSEVDIMEGFGWNNVINQAVHWDGYDEEHKATVQKTTLDGLHEEFHVYTLEWHPEKYVFFIDGVETWRTEGGGVCNLPGYLIVSGELSTESWATSFRWAFDPRFATYPDSFIVDYVRVYQFPEGRHPFHGIPAKIPGRIEAEDFDEGENGVAYYDKTVDNSGNIYRVGDVDVQECEEGGYCLAWTADGEWVEYTLDVAGTGLYDVLIRSASPYSGGTIQMDRDNEALTGNIELPETSDWQIFQTTTLKNITLEGGEQIMRLNIVKGNFNLNHLEFVQRDIVFNLKGIEDGASYDIYSPIDIEISASSNAGKIETIGIFMGVDSLAGVADSTYSMTYIPDATVAGWNTLTIKIRDSQNNVYSHAYNVYFGNLYPFIEFVEIPGDTLIVGEENTIVLNITDADGTVDSVHVAINEYEFTYENSEGRFEFELDTLPAGDYQMIVEAFDNDFNSTSDTLSFVIVLVPNKLPLVAILSPRDQSVLYYSAGNSLTVEVSDADGTIESLDLYVDEGLIMGKELEPGRFDIDFLTQGVHALSIEAIDDRGGIAIDSVEVLVTDSLVTIDPWTLYLMNGALASFSIDNDTLKVDVERASGVISDIQLMKDMEYAGLKSEPSYVATFKAYSDKNTYLTLALKDKPFQDDTLISRTYFLTPRIDAFSLSEIPETDSHNILTFFLGYRKDVSVNIFDFQTDILSSSADGSIAWTGTIYPNPVSEILYFSMETDYWIYTLSGSLLLEGKKATKSDLSALPGGLYVVKTDYGTFKFTKE